MAKSRRLRKIASCVVLASLAATIGIACAWVVWLGDDVDYAQFISDSIWDSYGRIDTVRKFFFSQGNHYWFVNGRAVAHALVQLFCGVLGQTAFAVCNALVYCLFVWLIVRTAVRRPLRYPAAVLTVSALVLMVFVTKMMPTTQIGYVWMFVLNLLWLRCFFEYRCCRVGCLVAVAAFSVIAGNSQEALTPGIAGALCLRWLWHRGRVPVAQTVWLVCYITGMLACALSPGTLHRAQAAEIPFIDSLIYLLMSLRATYVALAVIAWMMTVHHVSLNRIWRINRLWITAWAILLVFNICVGVYSNRQLFGLELCALVVLVRALHARFSRFWSVLAMIAAAVLTCVQLSAASEVRRQYFDIENEALKAGGGVIHYDRTRASNSAYLREYHWYEDIVGQYNNDTHHSLQKRLHFLYPELKYVNVWPEFINGRKSVSDTVCEYAPGHFFVLLTDRPGAEHKAMVVRHVSMTPGLPAAQADTVRVFPRASVVGRSWSAGIILEDKPFTHIDSVYLIMAP